jgi:phosphohistidine phosphatase
VRTLILLRHGKSNWSDSTLADIDRPLAPRGERASKRIAKYMRRRKIRPDLVLCSTSVRTRQTLEAIQPSLGKSCAVELLPQLYAAS